MTKRIGYHVKELDRALEETFERTLAEEGLARRHWQAMTTLSEGVRPEAGLADALRPYLVTGAVTVHEVVAELTARRWVHTDTEGRLALTAGGTAALSRLRGAVQAVRARVMDGVSASDYHTTIATLERMAANARGPHAG
ncbi:MarR family transcriptional regulator [Rhizohabitans arisaemae]|uniref:MarR family transcriptional regulator n=1 Tax=Rhizohabitans arisaemae TaxID=2720610 RepID=UPI0024B1D74F|nr:MarR family transcriptional regulator [Rhizohabitans arisaemae]